MFSHTTTEAEAEAEAVRAAMSTALRSSPSANALAKRLGVPRHAVVALAAGSAVHVGTIAVCGAALRRAGMLPPEPLSVASGPHYGEAFGV